jgi:uncharacterized protein (TIGR02118 family)
MSMDEAFSSGATGTTRRAVVGAMIAAPAALALPGVALAADTPAATPPLKIFSIVVRKPDLSQDSFRQHWIGIHGPMARKVPGIAGFILSEAVQDSAAAAPGANYTERFDGIAHSWYPAPGVLRAGMADPQSRAWLADGDLFIDRAASRNFFVREQVVVPIARAEGGLKRTSLLVRKPGMTHEQFMEHWTKTHAELAQGVPGLRGCVFNRIETAMGSQDGPWGEIDGIAELWWDSGAVDLGGRVVSPQSGAWAANGDMFIDRSRSRTIVSLEHVMIPPSGWV